MSDTLTKILEVAADEAATTVTLSGQSVTVLLFALSFIENVEAWLDLAANPLDEVSVADWDTIEELTANAAQEIMTGSEVIVSQNYEGFVAIPAMAMRLISGSATRTMTQGALTFGVYVSETGAASGDEWAVDVLLDVGTYRMEVQWRRDTDCGQYEFKIDGDTVNAGDLYGAGSIQVAGWDVEIGDAGVHQVSMLCVGKNAASSAYRTRLGAIIFTKVP